MAPQEGREHDHEAEHAERARQRHPAIDREIARQREDRLHHPAVAQRVLLAVALHGVVDIPGSTFTPSTSRASTWVSK